MCLEVKNEDQIKNYLECVNALNDLAKKLDNQVQLRLILHLVVFLTAEIKRLGKEKK